MPLKFMSKVSFPQLLPVAYSFLKQYTFVFVMFATVSAVILRRGIQSWFNLFPAECFIIFMKSHNVIMLWEYCRYIVYTIHRVSLFIASLIKNILRGVGSKGLSFVIDKGLIPYKVNFYVEEIFLWMRESVTTFFS